MTCSVISGPAKGAIAIAAFLTLCTVPAAAATVNFSDTTFDPASYSLTPYTLPDYGTDYGRQFESGNFYLSFSYFRTGANLAGNRLHAFNTGFVYEPSTQGAITSIDASLDQLAILNYNGGAVPLTNAARSLRLLALQDGAVFEAVVFGAPIGTAFQWYDTSASGLVASDFLRFDPANPGAPRTQTGLDFAGSAITFGFELAPFGVVFSDGSPVTGRSNAFWAADNFRVTLNTADFVAGVPEPSAWALLITGFGITGGALRRRRKHRVALAYC